jgi:hypothetical protein
MELQDTNYKLDQGLYLETNLELVTPQVSFHLQHCYHRELPNLFFPSASDDCCLGSLAGNRQVGWQLDGCPYEHLGQVLGITWNELESQFRIVLDHSPVNLFPSISLQCPPNRTHATSPLNMSEAAPRCSGS